MIISIKPTKTNWESNRDSIISLKKTPTTTAGIIETRIFNEKTLALDDFFEKTLLNI